MFKEKKRSYRFNVKKPVCCILLTDTASEVTYDTEIMTLGEAMQIQTTVQIANGELFGDGIKTISESMIVGMTTALDITKIPSCVAARIQGHEVVEGVVIDNANDEAPYIAVGYMLDSTGGEAEYVWLLKGKAKPINDSVQQRTTTLNYSTQTLNVDFIPRIFDNRLRFYADTTHEDFTDEQAEKWFATPPIAPPKKVEGGK